MTHSTCCDINVIYVFQYDRISSYVASVQKDAGCLSVVSACLRTLSSVMRAVYCTYPVPLHAHTHFLATVWPALVFHRVGGQTLAASLLLAGLGLAQDLRHALLMNGVQTLKHTQTHTDTQGSNKCQFK